MISNDRDKFLFNKKIDYLKTNLEKGKVKSKEIAEDSKYKTEIKPLDVLEVMKTINAVDSKDNDNNDIPEDTKSDSSNGVSNNANDCLNDSSEILKFIAETLEGANIEVTDELISRIFIEIVKAVLGENEKITLNLNPNITWVTTLVDAYLQTEDSKTNSASKDENSTVLTTKLIDILLTGKKGINTTTSVETVKRFIISTANLIIDEHSQTPQGDGVTQGNSITDGEIIDASNYPAELTQLINKMNSVTVDKNLSINDYLLQFKAEAAAYIQSKYGYGEGFSDIIAMFLAKAVSDTQGTESGLMKDVNITNIETKFLEFIQDNSFLDTTQNVMARSAHSGKSGSIEYIRAIQSEDGYVAVGRNDDKIYIHGNNDLTYSADGKPNNGVFLKFLTDYMKHEIYGASLNESQLALIMERVIREFGGDLAAKYKNTDSYCICLYNNRTALDKNKNNTFFDEFYNAIIKISESVQNIDTSNITSIDLNELFGNSNTLSAAKIHQNENSYFLSNDPGIRAIMSALVNASNKYNVTTNVDYLDFLNVFIKMIYQKCGEEVVTDNKGNPVLTRTVLEKYLEMYSAQELKEFVESKELRNAYYIENFIQTGGINEEVEDFNQGLTGDCWLLSCLDGLNESERGRQIIADAINSYVGEDGKTYYTVTLQGGYKDVTEWNAKTQSYVTKTRACNRVTTYTFSMDDIFDARATGNYSKGDWDVLLFEMAISKLKEEQYYHGVAPDEEGDPFIHGGLQTEMMQYLVGTDNFITTSWSIYNNADGKAKAQACKEYFMGLLNDGTIKSGTVGDNYLLYINYGSHAYAITGVTEEGFYYTDPYHPEKTKFISWEELTNCIVGYDNNGDPIKKPITIGRILLK